MMWCAFSVVGLIAMVFQHIRVMEFTNSAFVVLDPHYNLTVCLCKHACLSFGSPSSLRLGKVSHTYTKFYIGSWLTSHQRWFSSTTHLPPSRLVARSPWTAAPMTSFLVERGSCFKSTCNPFSIDHLMSVPDRTQTHNRRRLRTCPYRVWRQIHGRHPTLRHRARWIPETHTCVDSI